MVEVTISMLLEPKKSADLVAKGETALDPSYY
jgi:hypothetical protein